MSKHEFWHHGGIGVKYRRSLVHIRSVWGLDVCKCRGYISQCTHKVYFTHDYKPLQLVEANIFFRQNTMCRFCTEQLTWWRSIKIWCEMTQRSQTRSNRSTQVLGTARWKTNCGHLERMEYLHLFKNVHCAVLVYAPSLPVDCGPWCCMSARWCLSMRWCCINTLNIKESHFPPY